MRRVDISRLDGGEVSKLFTHHGMVRLASRLRVQECNGALLADFTWSDFAEASDDATADRALALVTKLAKSGVPPEHVADSASTAPFRKKRTGRRSPPPTHRSSGKAKSSSSSSSSAAAAAAASRSSSKSAKPMRARKGKGKSKQSSRGRDPKSPRAKSPRASLPSSAASKQRGAPVPRPASTQQRAASRLAMAVFACTMLIAAVLLVAGGSASAVQLRTASDWTKRSLFSTFGLRLDGGVGGGGGADRAGDVGGGVAAYAAADDADTDPGDDPYEFLNDEQFLKLRRVRKRKPRVNYVMISDCCGVRFANDIDGGVFLLISFFDKDRRVGIFVNETDAKREYRHLVGIVGEEPIVTAASKSLALLQRRKGSSMLLIGFIGGESGELIATYASTRKGKRHAGRAYDCAVRAAALRRTTLESVGCALEATRHATTGSANGTLAVANAKATTTSSGMGNATVAAKLGSFSARLAAAPRGAAAARGGHRRGGSGSVSGALRGRTGRKKGQGRARGRVQRARRRPEPAVDATDLRFAREAGVTLELIASLERNYAAVGRAPLDWRAFSQKALLQLLQQSYQDVASSEASSNSVAALSTKTKRATVRNAAPGGVHEYQLDAPLAPLSASIRPSSLSFASLVRPDDLDGFE